MATRKITCDAFASIDRWSRLEFQELVAEARSKFSAGSLDEVHDLCLIGLTQFPNAAALLTVLGGVFAQLHTELSALAAAAEHGGRLGCMIGGATDGDAYFSDEKSVGFM